MAVSSCQSVASAYQASRASCLAVGASYQAVNTSCLAVGASSYQAVITSWLSVASYFESGDKLSSAVMGTG